MVSTKCTYRIMWLLLGLAFITPETLRAGWVTQDRVCFVPTTCDETITGKHGTTTKECTESCLEFHEIEGPNCVEAQALCSAACKAVCEKGASNLGFNFERRQAEPALCEGLSLSECWEKAKTVFK